VFDTNKATLVSIEEKIDTSTPAGLLFYTMIAAIGQWEREEIVARVRSSLVVRAKMGKQLSGVAPYGFRWEDKKLVQVPEEVVIRKLAFELFMEHRRKGAVARLLNQRGYRTRNACKFVDMNIARMLRCPSAKGAYRINIFKSTGKGWGREAKPESEWGVSPCQRIVSDSVFDHVNQILEEQYKPGERPAKKPVHVFAGIVRCECGGRMYVYSRSPNYACKDCKNKIAITALDELFLGSIQDTLSDSGKIARHLKLAKARIAQRERDAVATRQQIEGVKTEMRKVYELYMAGGVDVERFKSINLPLEERLRQMNEELARIEGETLALQVNDLSAEAIVHESKSLGHLWPTLDTEGKQRMASLLCSSIIIPKDDPEAPIEITLKHTDTPSETDPVSNRPNSLHNLSDA
ncbi:MAG: recombinase family protein, partial [Verrucomicrobiaceae bacterium]|nr:recombinase family protein [Verrucomicrobiaceae bacterium]